MAAGAVCLNLAILFSGAWVLTEKIAEANRQLSEKKTFIEEIHRGWERMKDEDKLSEINSSIGLFEDSFFPKEDPLSFINEIESRAQENSRSFEINFVSSGGKESGDSLSLRVSLLGSFEGMMEFLRYLENMRYYVQIQQVQAARVDAKEAAADRREARAGDIRSTFVFNAFTR